MTSKIRVLDEHTINKIAAGEVIESPASVVKELVENSIDAGATEIVVEIMGGGRQMIRITDNGCGMVRDDALLCLERHATSKLRAADDLFALQTLGFRGEAIPSIASISKFSLLTSPNLEKNGTLILVEGGKILQCANAPRAQGTTIEVKSLFFNVPVRKKFQKSPAYDANEILKIVSLIVLGNPTLGIKLVNNGQTVLSTSVGQQFSARLAEVLGREFADSTVWIEEECGPFRVTGYLGLPHYTRHNRTGQYVFINRRPVFLPLAAYAVKDGFGTALAQGRHPVYVLYIELAPELVDVNVHPQKREVRLRQEGELRELICKGVLHALQMKRKEAIPLKAPFQVFEKPFQPAESDYFGKTLEPIFHETANWNVKAFPPQKLEAPPIESTSLPLPAKPSYPPKVLATIQGYVILDPFSMGEFKVSFPSCKEGGLFLFDQKAAFARVMYEKFRKQRQLGGPPAVQNLLIPYTFDLPKAEAHLLNSRIPELNHLGFQIREFGTMTYIVDSVPQILSHADIPILIQDLIAELGNSLSYQQEMEKGLAKVASRVASGRQGRLNFAEAQSLVDQLFACSQPLSCPYGKPTISYFAPEDLAKQFQKC